MKNSFQTSSLVQRALLLSLIFLVPSLAQAHPGMPGHTHGFSNGLLHPLTGLDHICAMVAVGLWAAQRGGRALWLVPTTFVSIMIVGGILGMGGVGIPYVEQGIAASVLVLGIFIAAAVRLPLAASMVIVGLFAIFHGYAHGAEMPGSSSGFAYGIGCGGDRLPASFRHQPWFDRATIFFRKIDPFCRRRNCRLRRLSLFRVIAQSAYGNAARDPF
jgi:urease accessory protein